ncbi:MFS general substrate transporter [Annulohypoxylon maeteangense]|uniref:MFS general substrate transporter n=1 Tax=Annulohypoxylon maeteangense TaxID=1927788 RepID=UPI002007E38D|nr:MFS general substrate transporter [Annulohypoxylon maeteangense]KAI0887626.1 MFS general substrate transporter [Annulohypoxylon maeteangense]
MVHQPEHQQPPASDSEDVTISNSSFVATSEKVDVENANASPAAPAAPEPPRTGPPPPPNGGLVAWLHVLGGFMLFFNTWGILNAFGVFQTYYEGGAMFERSSSDISWIGSIQSFMVLLGGVFAGPIYDRGYLRHLLILGSFGIVFGHMMLSLCTQYWEVVLAQGLCVGLGAGMLFVPCVSILPTYFSTKLGLAVGLASAGSSVGGVIYPIVLYQLLDKVGYAWSVRIMGFIALATLLIPISIMKMRFKAPKARSLIDWTAFRDVPYMFFTLTTFIGFMGLSILIFYISFYPQEQGLTDEALSFYMVPIFNAASCFGRILPNALSDKIGPFNVVAPCSLITGILMLCLMAAHTRGAVIAIAVLVGFFSGVFIAMPPVCFFPLTQDKSKLGTRIGMGFGIIALGLLAGGPIAGAILGNVKPLNWYGLWGFGGGVATLSGFLYSALRVYRSGFALNIKA